MDRKEFLSLLGISAAAFTVGSCLQNCSKGGVTPVAPPTVNFNLDLTAPANNALNTLGGYMYSNGVIVAHTNQGAFIAVSQVCPHQGSTVIYQGSINDFFCPSHGSTFAPTGKVVQGPAVDNLKSYSTQLNGNSLHVWG
jgi:cytochrome b6-f complex iron-sulfur subunit